MTLRSCCSCYTTLRLEPPSLLWDAHVCPCEPAPLSGAAGSSENACRVRARPRCQRQAPPIFAILPKSGFFLAVVCCVRPLLCRCSLGYGSPRHALWAAMEWGGARKCSHRESQSASPLRPGVPSGAQESLPGAPDQLDCETHCITYIGCWCAERPNLPSLLR